KSALPANTVRWGAMTLVKSPLASLPAIISSLLPADVPSVTQRLAAPLASSPSNSVRLPRTVKPGVKPDGNLLELNRPPALAPATASSLLPAEVLVVTPRLALPLASRPAKTIREMDMTNLRGRPCRPAVARGQQIKLLTLLESWERQSPACLRCQPAPRPELSVPGGAGVAEAGVGDHGGPVHLPNHDFATVVLPQDVGEAVAVEVAGAPGVPGGAGIAEADIGNHIGAVQCPDYRLAAVVLPQDVG